MVGNCSRYVPFDWKRRCCVGDEMNYYEMKFAREAKAHPTCWIIAPTGRGTVHLVRIAPDPKPKPQLKLVVNND